MFYEPVRQLVSINNLVAAGKASGERVFEVLDIQVDIKSPRNPVQFPQKDHTVTFSDVTFSYNQKANIVKNLSFQIPHGSTTALVGPTGAGKSTIANLLLRYYDVSHGSVSINGTDVRNLGLNNLRENIGFVSQDPFLFDTTIRENLSLASPQASTSEIKYALKAANAMNFISKLPLGIDTSIGEKGIRLSMGEKQRLTLARAILKAPPIMILDEATSSVDVETEREIQITLSQLTKNNTTLIIAHRLSTIREADQIIFLENGRIMEQGNHSELIRKSGKYSSFCSHQGNLIK